MTAAVTIITVQRDGPYVVTGSFALAARGAPRDDTSVVLCRCGRSANKPYCDGAHVRAGFVDAGIVDAAPEAQFERAAPRLSITPEPNGPLRCTGQLALCGTEGHSCLRAGALLCRCGASANKPFCDRSHLRIGFVG